MAMKKQFKLAACFFLLAVLLGSDPVDACQTEDQDCSTEACCDGLVCVEVSDGVFQCEPEECEEHKGHTCDINVQECCDPLVCACNSTCIECTLEYGQACDPNGSECCQRRAECSALTSKCECATACTADCDCCVGAVCSTGGLCECKKKEGDSCDPNALVYECCDLDCVQVSVDPEAYECHVGS